MEQSVRGTIRNGDKRIFMVVFSIADLKIHTIPARAIFCFLDSTIADDLIDIAILLDNDIL